MDKSAYDAYRNRIITSPRASTGVPADYDDDRVSPAAIAARQPLRFASYAYDTESALYYLSARYYDPATMQFISRDPIKADAEESLYQYCSGDPVQNTDPSGFEMLGYMISMEAHAGIDRATAYAFHSNAGSKKARDDYSARRNVSAKEKARLAARYQDFETASSSGRAWKAQRAAENKKLAQKVAASKAKAKAAKAKAKTAAQSMQERAIAGEAAIAAQTAAYMASEFAVSGDDVQAVDAQQMARAKTVGAIASGFDLVGGSVAGAGVGLDVTVAGAPVGLILNGVGAAILAVGLVGGYYAYTGTLDAGGTQQQALANAAWPVDMVSKLQDNRTLRRDGR